LCYYIILDQQQLFCKKDEPVSCYNRERAPLLWAETYVDLLFRVLNLAVTVRTNRLDIRNFSFVHTLELYDNFPIQNSLIGLSNGNRLCPLRGPKSVVINFILQHDMKAQKRDRSIVLLFLYPRR